METTLTPCPYCGKETTITLPDDYAPVFSLCTNCKKEFIIERLAKGFSAMTVEEAPSCSDPDRRAIETGGSDEQ